MLDVGVNGVGTVNGRGADAVIHEHVHRGSGHEAHKRLEEVDRFEGNVRRASAPHRLELDEGALAEVRLVAEVAGAGSDGGEDLPCLCIARRGCGGKDEAAW